jgi:hypothetical protein
VQQWRGAEVHSAKSLIRAALLALGLACASAQAAPPEIVFAGAAQGREILSRVDEYVRATSALERRAHLRSAEPVDEATFARRQSELLQEWPDEARSVLAPAVARLQAFIAPIRASWPKQILLVRTDPRLEDGSAFTRANAAFLVDDALSPRSAHYFLAHETFHILSRHDPALRERLYALIGFQRCGKAEIPERVARLRITNPDAVSSVHAIRVRYRGQPADALPFIRFPSEAIDPQQGFLSQMVVRWLLADRVGDECRVRETAAGVEDAEPDEFEGLYEQIGRNTSYLFHPEEILADNFAILFLASLRGSTQGARSPEILEKLRAALFGN